MYQLELKDVIGAFIDEAFDYSSDDTQIKDFLQGMIAAIPIIMNELRWLGVITDATKEDESPKSIVTPEGEGTLPYIEFYPASSIIQHVEYWPKIKELFIEFKKTGKIYAYQNVPVIIFNEFKASESKGKYFNQYIKTKYQYADVTEKGEEN